MKAIERFIEELGQQNPKSIVFRKQLPQAPPLHAQLNQPLPEPLDAYLQKHKLSLYAHQIEILEKVRAGDHVVITTPTASGKTLAFNLAIFESLCKNSSATALYLYPLKALTQVRWICG